MSKNKAFWDVFWQVVKFILTLGLSHIAKRDKQSVEHNIDEVDTTSER